MYVALITVGRRLTKGDSVVVFVVSLKGSLCFSCCTLAKNIRVTCFDTLG